MGRLNHQQSVGLRKESAVKGYFTDGGYMGYVDGRYMLFVSESEYREFCED